MICVGKKINLPVFADDVAAKPKLEKSAPSKRPSIDAARTRLGGRTQENEPRPPMGMAPGVIVSFALGGGRRILGVIVFASVSEVHVLLDSIRLRRLPPNDVALHDANANDVTVDLTKLAADARLFGDLVEGDSVRYLDDSGELIDGKVVEKCRWGALVLRDDGAIVAVGFRKLWPTPNGAAV
jgi:hypothetical protein